MAETATAPATDAQPDALSPANPTSAEDDATDRAIFDQLSSQAGTQEAAPKADEGEPKAPDTVAPQKDQAQEGATIAEPEGFDDALKAHLRDGIFSEGELREMFHSDPDKFVERGQKIAKRQKDQDDFGNEYRDWVKNGGETKPAESEDPRAEEGSAAPLAENADVTEIITKMREDALDPDGVDGLNSLIKAVRTETLETAKNMFAEQNEKLITQDAQIRDMLFDQVDARLSDARRSLSDKYPKVEDAEEWNNVLEHYDTLVETGRYETVDDAIDAALRWRYSDESKASLKDDFLRKTQARQAGSPRAATAATEAATGSPDDDERAAFNRLHAQHYGGR
jgi:Arc/MetJ-type ribon-helix-helix transcriptional regulator